MIQFVQNVIDALSFGSLYALFALGVALIFGIMNLLNFAHGSVILIAAYVMAEATSIPLWPRILVAIVAAVGLALLIDRIAFRTVRGADAATLLITSFAVSYLLQNVCILIFGSLSKATNIAGSLQKNISVGSLLIRKLDIVSLVVTIVLLVAMALLLGRTSIGIQMRAAAEDFRTARTLGVRANVVIASAFGISGILAAVAAVLYTSQTGLVTPTTGSTVVFTAFIATTLGGLGSLKGSVIGGYALGLLTVLLQAYLPHDIQSYRDAVSYLIVFVILAVKPSGLAADRSSAQRV